MRMFRFDGLYKAVVLAGTLLVFVGLANAQRSAKLDDDDDKKSPTPPGLYITPTALANAVQQELNPGLTNYPDFVAGEAVKAVVSPDGKTLAVLTAGMNSLYYPNTPANITAGLIGKIDTAASTQFLFLYDVSSANKSKPVLKQVIQQLNSHVGLVWAPNSQTLYAAGGCDDVVYVYSDNGTNFGLSNKISLGHAPNGCLSNAANRTGLGLGVEPNVAGLAITADGKTLVAANNYNDSISLIDAATGTVRYEFDLRPYASSGAPNGTKGGTFPYSVVLNGSVAYVGCDRDREVVAVNVASPTAGSFLARIQLDGNPNGMTLSADGSTLYVAQDNQDQVAVIDTASNKILHKIDTRGPARLDFPPNTTGAAPTSVTINQATKTLYAVNAGSNSIAVIPLSGPHAFKTIGLIPTAYDPTDVAFSADGSWTYIINGKNDTGPNPGYGYGNLAFIQFITFPGGNAAESAKLNSNNQYQFQLEHASLVSAAVPSADDLWELTSRVAANNGYLARPSDGDAAVMQFLHSKIKHIIYVVKENRTFDQILGDLGNGSNGDATLTRFGASITPNFHSLATKFVTLDNFTDPGDGSMDGWSWALQGRVTNTETITQQINYAFVNRGLSYESEGANRSVPVNLPTVAQRDAAAGPAGTTNYSSASAGLPGGTTNLLTGTGNHASSDAPFGIQNGYIFDAVLQAGGTVRNYGFLVNNIGSIGTKAAPVSDPFTANIVQVGPLAPSLAPLTDVFFRGYDQNYPDLWRYNEWKREFDAYVTNKNLPSLSLVRFSHDHTGSFATALAGVNTPETQQADC